MDELTTRVEAEPDATTIWLAGELTLASTSTVRETLLRCLADCPNAVIVDLSGVTADSDAPLAVFTAVARHAAQWPGIPVLLCAPVGPWADRLANRAVFRDGAVYDCPAQALAALGPPMTGSRTVRAALSNDMACSRQARRLVADACVTWGLDELSDVAQLIASELAANAVRHGSPPLRVLAAVRNVCLHIVVRDGSLAQPQLAVPARDEAAGPGDHGRGLRLINAFASSWGSLATPGGKAVWATLRIHPIS